MKAIELTGGFVALVDDEDYERLAGRKWWARQDGGRVYAVARIQGRNMRMHRFIMDAQPGQMVDHINGIGIDNRRSNLRFVDRCQNGQNSRKRKKTSSQFKGVSWHQKTKKWQAYIRVHGRLLSLGYHAEETVAALAHDAAARKYFGEYAALNFALPGEQSALGK